MKHDFAPASEFRFDDIAVGQSFELVRSFSDQDVQAFAALSGDYSPLHVDAGYAAGTEFGSKVVGKSDATRTLVLNTEIRSMDDKVLVTGTAKVKVRDDLPPAPLVMDSPIPSPIDSSRPVALVTGASRGIGAQIARTLAKNGYAVAVNYFRSADRALQVVREIELAGGIAFAVKADVRNADSVSALIAQVQQVLGPPRVLVNAAVGDLINRQLSELSWPDFEGHMAYQVQAVLQLCQAVYPAMKAAGGGAIVNILSQVTIGVPASGMADYVCAKYALMGLSKAMAAEWAEAQIRVNMVSPGLTRTELTEHYQERVFKMEAARTPLKRIATPADVAQAVAYLVAEQASFLTGVNLLVAGGQVMF